jgi:signal transduction histidine kinase
MANDTKIKILILEDMKDDVLFIERVLRKSGLSFITAQVDTRDEFIEGLEKFRPDIVLSDHALPQFNSIEAYKICKEKKLSIPFILVTGTVSEEFAVTCLKLGVDDYILKSNLSRLPTAILSTLKQKRLEKIKQASDKKLKKQNENILKVNKELDSFVYSISHSLRAPLASVLGLLNIAKMENEQGEFDLAHVHGMMETSIRRLDNTLVQMLDYSRNARLDLKPGIVDVEYLISKSFKNLAYLEGIESMEKNIECSDIRDFYSDNYRLEVIFTSIISNSIKYRDPSKSKSILTIKAHSTKYKHVISFQDNGVGIKEEFLPNVYNMFYRADERSDGSGLGLYIVKEIVDKLKGTVLLTSEENVGTFITLTFPNMRKQSGNQ